MNGPKNLINNNSSLSGEDDEQDKSLVLNDLNAQQQHYYNQSLQTQQLQQLPQARNQHNLNILQAAFATDGSQASNVKTLINNF